jgi:5-methylcytosine-specific restriction endonuclease McrA
MSDSAFRGWTKIGAQSYRHHCGAKVSKRGNGPWTAKTVDGAITNNYKTAEQACNWIENNDPTFWTYGTWAMDGCIEDIVFTSGFLDENRTDHVAVCFLSDRHDFPAHLISAFKKYFLGKATCAKCMGRTAELCMRKLPENDYKGHLRSYIVCTCGYPVWRLPMEACFSADNAIKMAGRAWRRKTNLSLAGGKHNQKEIQDILVLQENRCIYCNILFTDKIRPTKDHLFPVVSGGTNWALNLVMACRRCNSRRCDIPFRTYYKLLSATQNRRILRHLGRRLMALQLDQLPDGAFTSFQIGIANHDPRDGRYLDILSTSARTRQNSAKNRVMPGAAHLILRRAYPLLP